LEVNPFKKRFPPPLFLFSWDKMKCPNCGELVNDEEGICVKCGIRLKEWENQDIGFY